ncbi:DUF2867 domain-containing protein [Lentisalinibacter orientalis]|uniref:DUF2867 domain-containing protein n=1 Tax=Lentisalinibacter orientalis TaxID=2992241 RepID=UPI0038689DE2
MDQETNQQRQPPGRRAVVIGASGYIGTNLVPRLHAEGWSVRATSRNTDVLAARGWHGVELMAADVLDPESLRRAVEGADVVFYLVHLMAAGGDFAELERRGAHNMVAAADAAGVERIVYLGGLAPEKPKSRHLQARLDTGEILRTAACRVVEIRAPMIVGPGSAAWEVMRDLVNHLPVMVTPRWVASRSTPIALENLLTYLIGVAEAEVDHHPVFEVGGPEICTYEEMMRTYADIRGKRIRIVTLPVLTTRLSSYWLRLITAVPTKIAAALIEGLSHDYIAEDAAIRELIPQRLLTFREAAEAALEAEQTHTVEGRWVEGSLACREWNPDYAYYAKRATGVADSTAQVETLWRQVLLIGRRGDFFYANWLWWLRRLLDWMVGGTSMRRRRRHPTQLRVGDVFDGWRVIGLIPRERLTLLMEMRAPGGGVLEFEIGATETGSRVRMTAYWHPAGVWGLMYWYALLPAHLFLFRGTTRELARRAEAAEQRARLRTG